MTADIATVALAALELAEKATPDPWVPWGHRVMGRPGIDDERIAVAQCLLSESVARANAEFVAAARTLLPILASWVASVAPALERLRAASSDQLLEWEAVDALLAAAEET